MTAGSDIENGLASSLIDRSFFFAQPREQGAPRRVGERREGAIEVRSEIVNHMVKYRAALGGCQAGTACIFR